MKHILCSLLAASLMTACAQDEPGSFTGGVEGVTPLVLTAGGLQAVATPASTRATVDGNWDGVQTVAVEVDGVVKEYSVSTTDAGKTTATLSSTAPFYWTTREDITVSAWWPYAATMPAVVVKADQSTKEAFEGSDFIAALNQTVQFDNPTLTFEHQTARVTVKLQPGSGVTSVEGAEVSLTNLDTDANNPSAITPYAPGSDTYEALLAPQTVEANTAFIQVELNGDTYIFRPKNAVKLEANNRYNYDISVTAKGLELAACTISGWADGGTGSGNITLQDCTYDENTKTYTVYTAEGLNTWAEAANKDLSTKCTLMADIDLSGVNWEPVAFGDNNIHYTGIFDGNGHTISNLTITNRYFNYYCGMFGRVGTNATIKNMTLENVSLNVSSDEVLAAIGALAGSNQGIISNCNVSGNISTKSQLSYVGGIVGRMDSGVIQYCHSSASIQGGNSTYVGGVLGGEYATATVIKGCSFSGSITSDRAVGGVAGYCRFFNDMIGCYSVGELSNLSTTAYRTGGVVGFLQINTTANACYWSNFDGVGVGYCNENNQWDGAYKVDGEAINWAQATEAMNAALGTDATYLWHTDDPNTPPTLVPNNSTEAQ